MAKILVTGANGFLGSWVVRGLLQEDHEVFCLVRKSSDLSELEGLPVRFLYGDITDLESLKTAVSQVQNVFHLAGLIAYKKADRPKMDLVNVQGTQNVVDAIKQSSVEKLVHLSSVVAVGAGFSSKQILNEDSPYNVSRLNLGYFETKRAAEKIVRSATIRGEIQSVILNPSTIYGPGDAKKGSRNTQLKVARGKFPFYTSGGVSVVAVEDTVSGILSAWKKGRNGERYILSGENILIKDLFSIIANAAGVPAPKYLLPSPVLHLAGMVGDIKTALGLKSSFSRENAWTSTLYHWFDNSKAKKELDFKPQKAQAAIAQSVQWMQSHGLLT